MLRQSSPYPAVLHLFVRSREKSINMRGMDKKDALNDFGISFALAIVATFVLFTLGGHKRGATPQFTMPPGVEVKK